MKTLELMLHYRMVFTIVAIHFNIFDVHLLEIKYNKNGTKSFISNINVFYDCG